MPTQSRVPGAASSEVDFELERFERAGPDRIEIAGRWYGLRGRRFVRPVLSLQIEGGARRRAIALLEHKPWAADDGETWVAAFAWPQGAGEVESAVLEVGPGLIVDLPALGGKPASQVRVNALRPHAPAPMARRIVADEEDAATGATGAPVDQPERQGASSDRADRAFGELRSAPLRASDAPEFTFRERAPAPPPRDHLTAVIDERDEALAARDEAERERVRALNERDDALSRRDAALRDADRAAGERDEAFSERDRLAAELERVTRERDVADAERKRMMQDAEAIERERDQAAAERDAARSELSRALPEREHALREAETARARAERAESERDTAFAERKTAVAQRDRARRERDRAMRAAGLEPPADTPFARPQAAPEPPAEGVSIVPPGDGTPVRAEGAGIVPRAADDAPAAPAPARQGISRDGVRLVRPEDRAPAEGQPTEHVRLVEPAGDAGAAPPGTPLPSRPLKRIGTAPAGPAPEPKPLLTPVDSGRPRRLSRTRRPPSAPARWAVRMLVLLVLIAVVVVLAILLARVV